MAIPTFVGAGALSSGTGAVAPVLPTGYAIGDLFILFCECNQTETPTIPAGWFPVDTVTATATRLVVFARRATSLSEAAPLVSDPGDHVIAGIIALRGVQDWGPPWHVKASATEASDTSVSFPAVTTTIADCLIVNIIAVDTDIATARSSGQANAALSSLTEQVDGATTSGGGGGLVVITGGKATAGNTGSTTATLATASTKAMLTLAFGPTQAPARQTIILPSGTTSWTVPSDWNNADNDITVIGPGGNAASSNTSARLHGGGGGALSRNTNVFLTRGASVTVQVGAGGSETDTYFDSSLTLLAKAGKNGNNASATGEGAGGDAASGVGTFKSSGGAGGRSTSSGGSGGGGAGGLEGDGKAGGSSTSSSGAGGGGSNGSLATAGGATGIGGTGSLGTPGFSTAGAAGYYGSGGTSSSTIGVVSGAGGVVESWKSTLGVNTGPGGGGAGGSSVGTGGAGGGLGGGGGGKGTPAGAGAPGGIIISYVPGAPDEEYTYDDGVYPTLIMSQRQGIDGTGLSVPSVPIGTADAARICTFWVIAIDVSFNYHRLTGATIGGITATIADVDITGSGAWVSCITAAVPTGTTATVAVTIASGTANLSVLVGWNLKNVGTTPVLSGDLISGPVTYTANTGDMVVAFVSPSYPPKIPTGTLTDLHEDHYYYAGDDSNFQVEGSLLLTGNVVNREVKMNGVSVAGLAATFPSAGGGIVMPLFVNQLVQQGIM